MNNNAAEISVWSQERPAICPRPNCNGFIMADSDWHGEGWTCLTCGCHIYKGSEPERAEPQRGEEFRVIHRRRREPRQGGVKL